jgi:glutamate-1-semialdehyde aminotransferase
MADRPKLVLERSGRAFEEAQAIFPGGVLGIRRPYNFVPGEYPVFFESAKGGLVTDVDGNTYIDMLCAYGPIIIGHREDEIDDAVVEQIRSRGFCMSLCQEVQNRLGRKLQELIPSCEKLVFVKTGSDATSTAIRAARAFTNRTKVIRCGYHGWHDWCVEVKGGVPGKVTEDILEFRYNDLDTLDSLLLRHGSEVAAVIITPVGHPLGHAVLMPNPGFLEGVRDLVHRHGGVLIFDEIRSGFRVNLGGAQKEFGVTPDVAVFGKAMANGYPISAVVGRADIIDVYKEKAFLSSTFFPNSIEQVAALKTIELLERDRMLDHIRQVGTTLGRKVSRYVVESGVPCDLSGVPWMPFITFRNDDKKVYKRARLEFYTQLIRRGVFLQPFHHGYVAYRHTDQQMDAVAEAIGEVLQDIKTKYY